MKSAETGEAQNLTTAFSMSSLERLKQIWEGIATPEVSSELAYGK